jgi:hypothetical protein
VVFVLLLQGIDHRSGIFLFCNSSFFWFCPSVMLLGHCVLVEARYNCYLIDININIFHLSKKN